MAKAGLYINTIFRWCNDVDAMRSFYSDLLQLEETFYRNDDEHGWLTYQVNDVLLVFTRADTSLPVETEWAKSPAYTGGTKTIESWVMALNDSNYKATIERLKASNAPIYDGEIDRKQLLMLVKDPMGMTIELWLEHGDE